MLVELVAPAFAAGVLPAIALAHAGYFARGASRSTQHRFDVIDDSAPTVPVLAIHGADADAPLADDVVVTLRTETKVEGDLRVEGVQHFRRPLKVTGDLVVVGRAVFDGPVVVNGYADVPGDAQFAAGLLCKADLRVRGRAGFGVDPSGSWCVARSIDGEVRPVAAPAAAALDVRTA